MMKKIFSRKHLFPIIAFCFLDILAVGIGMGVPVFAIFFGFIVGWIVPSFSLSDISNMRHLLKECLLVSFLGSCLTFFMMVTIWGPFARMLLDPSADFVKFGIPMILYDPKVSFIGWIILMIFISPVLQLLSTVFSSVVRIIWLMPNSLKVDPNPIHSEIGNDSYSAP